MANLTKKIINCETGEETEIALTEQEIVEHNEYWAQYEANRNAETSAKATAQAKLAALGLTVEDLQILGL
jgi:hypothetical protein